MICSLQEKMRKKKRTKGKRKRQKEEKVKKGRQKYHFSEEREKLN